MRKPLNPHFKQKCYLLFPHRSSLGSWLVPSLTFDQKFPLAMGHCGSVQTPHLIVIRIIVVGRERVVVAGIHGFSNGLVPGRIE